MRGIGCSKRAADGGNLFGTMANLYLLVFTGEPSCHVVQEFVHPQYESGAGW